MRYLIFIFILQLLITVHGTDVNARVAEASTGNTFNQTHKYDLSDMSPEEIEWFNVFVDGTFFADGWQEISKDILVKIDDAERDDQRTVLNQLGYKIGREWCRDNDVRKISTSMLKKWGDLLRETAREEPHLLTEVLRDIDGEVESLLR